MAIISDEVKEIINNPESLKVIAVNDREGIPHIVYKGSLHVEGEKLVFYDLLQSSTINKNLVNAIWFDGKVAINVLSKDRRSFHIVGKPEKSLTAGKIFEKVYADLQEKKGRETDLNAIWFIEPEEIKEVTYTIRQKEQHELYPILGHLDQITRR